MITTAAARRWVSPIVIPSGRFLAVWRRHLDVFMYRRFQHLALPLVEPALTFSILGFGLGQFVELESGQDYAAFIAPGFLAAFPMWQAVFVCTWGSWLRMNTQQLFQSIVATPLEPEDVAAGEIAWGTTMALLSSLYVLGISLAFGLVDSPLAALVLPVAVVHGLLLSSLALAFASRMADSSALEYFFTVVALPMFWFGDVFFPVAELPEALQTVSWFVPTTHTVAIYRGLFAGHLEWAMLGDLAWIITVGSAFFFLALRGVRSKLVV